MAKFSQRMLVAAAAEGMNLHRNEVEFVTLRMFLFIGEALKRGEPVKLSGFGTFTVRHRAQKQGRNPRTGESHVVSAREVVAFAPSEKLLRKMK